MKKKRVHKDEHGRRFVWVEGTAYIMWHALCLDIMRGNPVYMFGKWIDHSWVKNMQFGFLVNMVSRGMIKRAHREYIDVLE